MQIEMTTDELNVLHHRLQRLVAKHGEPKVFLAIEEVLTDNQATDCVTCTNIHEELDAIFGLYS